jgi:hypothetical protein
MVVLAAIVLPSASRGWWQVEHGLQLVESAITAGSHTVMMEETTTVPLLTVE